MVFNSGGAAVDALISSNADIVTSGATEPADGVVGDQRRTPSRSAGVAGNDALPMFLLSRDPNVKSLKDFSSADKIAVPTVRVSTQAIVMQMAAAKLWGDADVHKFDQYTVAMGHPDALLFVETGKDVNGRSLAPAVPVPRVEDSGRAHGAQLDHDVTNGPASNGVSFATTKFHDANPKLIGVFIAAMAQAEDIIKNDKRHAAELYLKDTRRTHRRRAGEDHERSELRVLDGPTALVDEVRRHDVPRRHDQSKPTGWKNYFFPEIPQPQGS